MTCVVGRVLWWLCGVGECSFGHLIILCVVHKCGEYGKFEGLEQMKVGMWYLCEFCEVVGMVCGMVDGL